jgi:hypothetical protein
MTSAGSPCKFLVINDILFKKRFDTYPIPDSMPTVKAEPDDFDGEVEDDTFSTFDGNETRPTGPQTLQGD